MTVEQIENGDYDKDYWTPEVLARFFDWVRYGVLIKPEEQEEQPVKTDTDLTQT